LAPIKKKELIVLFTPVIYVIFDFRPYKIFGLIFTLVKKNPENTLNRPFSEEKKNQEILVFEWPIKGVFRNTCFTSVQIKPKIL